MTEEESLILAILDCPEDRTARVVFADFLDEKGYGEQAEIIRVRCSLWEKRDDKRRAEWFRREAELSEKHREDWVDHCELPLTWEQTLAFFRRRLAETVAWFSQADRPPRTPALFPRHLVWHGGHHPPYKSRTTPERQGIVNRLANRRRRLLAEKTVAGGLAGGRLLLFFPDATLFDGAAEIESGGFFDVDNIPAWDSWVSVVDDVSSLDPASYRSALVCWVPPAWLERVDGGIRVNPEECIRWASDVDSTLTRKLREAGLLA